MCLAIPMKVKKLVDENLALMEIDGTMVEVNVSLIEEPKLNDYLIIHAGFAIEKLDEEEARVRLELFEKLAEKQAFRR